MAHLFSDYVRALGSEVCESSLCADPVITQVTYDSRQVGPGALFICKGAHFHQSFLSDAIQRGAVAYVSETAYEDLAPGVPYATVTDMRTTIADIGALFYSRAWDNLITLGVTGTKGKSTTIFMLHAILSAWMAQEKKPRPGIISSILYDDGLVQAESEKTTPETLELYACLNNAVAAGLEYMCMEVSSQGLRYQRVDNVGFEVGCFLNIAEDHISAAEHADYEDYLSAKLALFSQSRLGVVNARTAEFDRVMAAASRCEKVWVFAREPEEQMSADITACDLRLTPEGQEFTVSIEGQTHSMAIGLRGEFNIDNALAALTIAHAIGAPVEAIREGLATARVPGRMDVFHLERGTTVIVDYAHQKLSVTTLLACVTKDYPSAPITMVFGTGGNKGWNRREELGTLAGEVATEIYLTEDDPGTVPTEEICHDIDRYVRAAGHKGAFIVPDRREAIERAMTEASDDGLVLLLGKGAERWQLRGIAPVSVPSDIDIVEAYIALT